MSPTLTVRTDDGDVTGDTVFVEGDSLRVLGRDETEAVPLDDVESIIADESPGADERALEVSA
jgi:hypothetical protein